MIKIIILLVTCSPFLLKAQGFQVSLQGQKQQAMGGAGTAFVQDGATLFYNPGGVAFLKQNSISAGASGVIFKAKFADQSSLITSETKSPVAFPFTGYLVLGKKESKLKYGLAAYTPFGSIIKWEPGWTGRFIVTDIKLLLVYVQPTVSYKISEKVGIGVGFVYGTGKVDLKRDLPVIDASGKYGSVHLNGNAKGYGYNVGIYYKPLPDLSFGLTYRSGLDVKLKKGSATFTVPATLTNNFPPGNFSTSLSLPSIATLGVAFSPGKKLTLAADASYIGWKSFDTLAFDFEKNSAAVMDTHSPRGYKNTSSYRIGAQYSITDKLVGRLGLNYLITPIKSGYVTPEVPDASRLNYTAGLGYKLSPRLTADVSFMFENLKRTDTNIENHLSGTYKVYAYIPGLSLTYNF